MTTRSLSISIAVSTVLATFALATGYALSRLPIGTLVIIAFGFFWLIGQQRGWGWTASLGLIGFMSAAAFGIVWGTPAAWMLFVSVATLIAWDLHMFSQRLQKAKHIAGEAGLIRSHLRRMLIVAGLGLVLGEIALGVQVEFSFSWALLLGLLASLGLSGAIGFLRRESD